MQPLKKFSPEIIRAIARNPNIDIQSIRIYSKSDIQHHIRTQQFQQLLTKMDTIQRQPIDQNLRNLAETAGFSDIYAQDYSGYFKDIKDYIYLQTTRYITNIGDKYRPQDISPIKNFSFVKSKNELLAFLGWPYYIIERLTILYAMFNFLGFLFSLLKAICNTCAIHTQVHKQASVARILFAGFFGIFSTSINKILLDAQIKEYTSKLLTTPNTNDDSQNNTNTTPTAPKLQNLNHNHPLSLVPWNFRIVALTNLSRSKYPQSPKQHIITQQPNIEDTYEQIIEQPHTTNFRSQNNYILSPRWAAKLDHSIARFPIQSTSRATSPSSHFSLSLHLNHLMIKLHPAWNQTIILTQPYITLSPNLIIPISKPPTNLPTPNPAYLRFPNLPYNLFIPKSKLNPLLLPLPLQW